MTDYVSYKPNLSKLIVGSEKLLKFLYTTTYIQRIIYTKFLKLFMLINPWNIFFIYVLFKIIFQKDANMQHLFLKNQRNKINFLI